MEGENFDVANWRIENISCWNKALHGKYIESPVIRFEERNYKLTLYPRATSGIDDRMMVYLSCTALEGEFSGDLSFISGEESTLWKQRVHCKGMIDIEIPPGPKYEEVIGKRGENVTHRNDHLTLRFQIKSDKQDENYICTVIQTFDVTLEIDPSVMEKTLNPILYTRYSQDGCESSLSLQTGKVSEDKIQFCLHNSIKFKILVKTHLRLISSNGSLLKYENNEHIFEDGGRPWTFSESLKKKELSENGRSVNLHLKIVYRKISHTLINMYMASNNVKLIYNRYGSVREEKPSQSVDVLLKELKCLYQEKDFSDLHLKCEGISFPVHKNILSARSTFLKNILSIDMAEDGLEIEDLDPSTLSRFLAFLYTGAVEDLQWDSALELYYAARKYDVPSLKSECVSFLRANFSVSNVCDALSLADKHKDHKLTSAAYDFILRNFYEVMKSKEWEDLKDSEPMLAGNTLTTFAIRGWIM